MFDLEQLRTLTSILALQAGASVLTGLAGAASVGLAALKDPKHSAAPGPRVPQLGHVRPHGPPVDLHALQAAPEALRRRALTQLLQLGWRSGGPRGKEQGTLGPHQPAGLGQRDADR